ncbi:GntR family transcriptional regulator [Streptomyces sp. AD681]|uniref:GntR family transcriptional regulator n=1 Tax=Streptomyces sp. AD681 TaxID=3019069 RepID=UPI0022F1CEB0|nr:GntR family transcriptional regulator [Streptomyces sp. AD681]MDA5143433.1 GntR family transcriptional regulator [Streptomyces sp. AD681]
MATPRGALQPITSRSVVEQATEELRRAILAGDLAPGSEYSLRELAGMLDISFIPIREALRSLESDGLVIMRPGRSAVVTPLDLDDLHGIYRLRRALEPEIARRSCGLLTDEELDRLESRAIDFGAREHGMADIYDDHHAFHLALLAPAATAWDIRVLTTLWRAGERYIRIGFGRLDPDPTEHERRGKAHTDLVAAFRTRDPDAVALAVEQHLARNEKIAFSALA